MEEFKSKIIAFIPIRGGSKSIPLKNITPFCKKPLVYWCLESLESSEFVEKIYVAVDSDKIAQVVESFGFSKTRIYWRNPQNARDESSTEDVILEFIEKNSFNNSDIFVLVQATNPFVRKEDIDIALQNYQKAKFDSMLSLVLFKRFLWNWDGKPINYDYTARPRRQDFKGVLLENGAFYISKVGNILKYKNRLGGKIGFYIMPEYSWIELDEPDHWTIAEMHMKKYQRDRIFSNRLKDVKLFLSDVDGTLTDGGMYYDKSGEIVKKFNTKDGMGFQLLKERNIKVGIITKEGSDIVRVRGKKLNLDYVITEERDKLKKIKEICCNLDISLEEVAYIGDDINDLELLKDVGFSACPSDAAEDVKGVVDVVMTGKGGEGCVREFAELILKKLEN